MALARGSSIGPYQILFRLGSGGMGEVYRARDTRIGRDVAIKVLSEEAVRDRDRTRRFAMESRAASALNHPNILAVHEVGESEFGPYIVTEFVDGDTVRSLLTEGPLPLERAIDFAVQAAEGVASAHGAGMVHRDLKPENLMVDRQGVVKILDFGLARSLRPEDGFGDAGHTAAGMVVGTAGYLSPEQLRGEKADERSDVFALGIVFYEMATGQNPFLRVNAADTFSAILRDDPAPLAQKLGLVSEELSRAVEKALAKKPGERHASAQELAAALRRFRAAVAGGPEKETLSAAPPAGPSRRAALFAAAGILAAALAALLVLRGC